MCCNVLQRASLFYFRGTEEAKDLEVRCRRTHSAVCCSVLQCDAACCSVLQRVAACCSVLQRIRLFEFRGTEEAKDLEVRCRRTHSAAYYSVLQCVAVCFPL